MYKMKRSINKSVERN